MGAQQKVAEYVDSGPTPITTNVLRVRGLPADQKKRDVFKLFMQFSTTRIRDSGGDNCFVEFTSRGEAEKAYRKKKGAALNGVKVQLEAATQDDLKTAAASAPPAAPKQDPTFLGQQGGAQMSPGLGVF